MFRLILFDIDGTLISTDGAGVKAFGRVFDEIFGLPNATKHMTFAGRTDRRLIREIFEANDIEPTAQNFHKFKEAYAEHLTRYLPEGKTEPLPAVRQIIAAFRKLNPQPVIGLLTGNHPHGAKLKLTHYNLWHEFAMGAFGDQYDDRGDVARDALLQGQSLIPDLQPEEILVIGDTERDIQCARSIGAKVLAVATGPNTVAELESFKPDWVIEDLTHISLTDLTQ
jgi:phosphoglycolate phosphatase-like HAD superfamily hydrolase